MSDPHNSSAEIASLHQQMRDDAAMRGELLGMFKGFQSTLEEMKSDTKAAHLLFQDEIRKVWTELDKRTEQRVAMEERVSLHHLDANRKHEDQQVLLNDHEHRLKTVEVQMQERSGEHVAVENKTTAYFKRPLPQILGDAFTWAGIKLLQLFALSVLLYFAEKMFGIGSLMISETSATEAARGTP